jgi:pimeloyl-ACP methyl ester carboxylesterase
MIPIDLGKSTPSAGDDDATPALIDNTTRHLIDDVSAVRRELNINGKMHVFGGSGGSTLALAISRAPRRSRAGREWRSPAYRWLSITTSPATTICIVRVASIMSAWLWPGLKVQQQITARARAPSKIL